MFKVAFFLWRRPDFDRTRFVDYYETQHAVLSHRLFPQPPDFRRNYPRWESAAVIAGTPSVFGLTPFDVMTELFHNDRAGFAAQLNAVTIGTIKEQMEQDELNFLNRNQQVLLVFDECGANNATHDEVAVAKVIRYVRRAADISTTDFRESYEKAAMTSGLRDIPDVVEYRRSYPVFDDPMSYAGNWHVQGRPDNKMYPLDLVEELWLSKPVAIEVVRRGLEFAKRLVDAGGTYAVFVDEYRSDFGTRMAPLAV